jgi:hypothetical protein
MNSRVRLALENKERENMSYQINSPLSTSNSPKFSPRNSPTNLNNNNKPNSGKKVDETDNNRVVVEQLKNTLHLLDKQISGIEENGKVDINEREKEEKKRQIEILLSKKEEIVRMINSLSQ